MADSKMLQAFGGAQAAAANEYSDAWMNGGSVAGAANAAGGAGLGSFSAAPAHAASTLMQTKPLQVPPIKQAAGAASAAAGASGVGNLLKPAAAPLTSGMGALEGKVGIDGLPTTGSTAAPAITPTGVPGSTTSNLTGDSPYAAAVTAAGDVSRSAERPEMLAIHDSMPEDEQYRRAWQNEANGYYNTKPRTISVTAPDDKAPEGAAGAPAEAAKPMNFDQELASNRGGMMSWEEYRDERDNQQQSWDYGPEISYDNYVREFKNPTLRKAPPPTAAPKA